jgi:cell division protein FtsN
MARNHRRGNPGARFAGFLVAVLIALLILVVLASRYKKINPTPKLDRKGTNSLPHLRPSDAVNVRLST